MYLEQSYKLLYLGRWYLRYHSNDVPETVQEINIFENHGVLVQV